LAIRAAELADEYEGLSSWEKINNMWKEWSEDIEVEVSADPVETEIQTLVTEARFASLIGAEVRPDLAPEEFNKDWM
jgi:hypothetical protein